MPAATQFANGKYPGSFAMRIRSAICQFLVVATALWAVPDHSIAAAADPSALVTELSEQAKLVLTDTTLTATERQLRLRILLDQDFDFPTISRFVLGRH